MIPIILGIFILIAVLAATMYIVGVIFDIQWLGGIGFIIGMADILAIFVTVGIWAIIEGAKSLG
tara:strand:- start:5073 stop:5264 length:192 start_codon:yes stop_codon:yes gene_type:complete